MLLDIRLVYYNCFLKKPSNELMRSVYEVQKLNLVKGDWTELVKNGFKEFDIQVDGKFVENMSKLEFKSIVKTKIKDNVFVKLKSIQEGHTKIKNIYLLFWDQNSRLPKALYTKRQ